MFDEILKECPSCDIDLEIEVYRWNTKTKCPSCDALLEVCFDFYYNEEDHEEYDLYDLKISTENNMHLDYSKSKIYDEAK